MFEVIIDPPRRLMLVRVAGFWDAATFHAYAAEAAAKAEQLDRGGGFDAILIDMSDYPLQAVAIADLHGELLLTAKRRFGCRAALVMRSALSRLQATRVARLTNTELYDDVDRALAALARPRVDMAAASA